MFQHRSHFKILYKPNWSLNTSIVTFILIVLHYTLSQEMAGTLTLIKKDLDVANKIRPVQVTDMPTGKGLTFKFFIYLGSIWLAEPALIQSECGRKVEATTCSSFQALLMDLESYHPNRAVIFNIFHFFLVLSSSF